MASARGGRARGRSGRVLALLLATAVAAPASAEASPWASPFQQRGTEPEAARPEDPAQAEALLAQADAARTEGRWTDAARLFTAAYAALPADLLPSLGETTVRLGVESQREIADKSGDPAPLREALALIDRFEVDLRAAGQPLPEALARTRETLGTDPRLRAPEAPAPVVDPPPAPAVDRAPISSPDRKRAAVSWTLVGVGSAAVVAGIATLVWGSRILPVATDRLDARGPDLLDPSADDDYLARHRRRGRAVMGVGAGIALVGLPLLVWGAVRLATARRAASSDGAAWRVREPPRARTASSGRGWSAR